MDNAPIIAKDFPLLVPDIERDDKGVEHDQRFNDLWEYLIRGEALCLVFPPGTRRIAVTLALLRNRERAHQHFDGILWASLGRQFVMLEELVKWADALHVPARNTLASEAEWIEAIKATIGQRRLLVVLDDVDRAKRASEFKALGPNCVYIMTTRHREIAEALMQQHLVTVVKEFDDVVGFELLKHLAPKAVEFDPVAAQTLADLLGEFPLALTLAGKYLKKISSQENPSNLRAAFRRIRQAVELANSKAAEQRAASFLTEIVDISYNALESEEARQAFLAISNFPPKPNTFSKNVAREVCGVDVDAIYELSDMGLIEHAGGEDYTMQPIVAQYAQDRLNTLGREASIK